jgi:MFS family permease
VAVGSPRAGFAAVLAGGEFRHLWAAQVLSLLGDQLSRVALTVLVWQRTGSSALTAVVYACSYLPAVLGGPLLAPYCDRRPRREVLVACDLGRALLVGLMLLPGAPVVALGGLLAASVLLSGPFDAARAALLPDLFGAGAAGDGPDERYVVASAISNITFQAATLSGLAVGGAVLMVLTPRQALALDAATFLASAALVRLGVAARPAPAGPGTAAGVVGGALANAGYVLGEPRLRRLVLMAWICAAAAVVPEGVAAPYAAALGAGPVGLSWLLAATSLGTVGGSAALARLASPRLRLRLLLPLAALTCLSLVACAAPLGLAGTVIVLTMSGVGLSFNLAANAEFVRLLPPHRRAGAFGVAQGGLCLGQGLALLLGGAATELVAPATTVAAAGGLAGLALLAIARPRHRRQASPGRVSVPAPVRADTPVAG